MERLGDGDFDPDDGVSMVASFPEVIGAGGSDYACPGCLRTICEAVAEGDVVGDVFECECGTLCRVHVPL